MTFNFNEILLITIVTGTVTLNILITGSLTVAVPSIGAELEFRESDLQWPVNVYTLSYGSLLILFGRLGDIVGSRIMFVLGTLWIAIWSVATAHAPNKFAFIIFIALTGIGAAANTPAALALITSSFPAGPLRGRAIGIMGAGQPLGFMLGLVLGGVFAQSKASWRAIYYFQFGLALAFLLLTCTVLRKFPPGKLYRKGLDLGGAVLSTGGMGAIIYSLGNASSVSNGWKNPQIPVIFCTGLLLLSIFYFYERFLECHNHPVLLPPSLWQQKHTKLPILLTVVVFGWWSFNTQIFLMTLYYQQILIVNPLGTSIRFIPLVLSAIVVNIISGLLTSQIPSLLLIVTGFCGNIIASTLFALIDIHSSYWSMAFFVMILVVGADLVYPVGSIYICNSMDEESQSLAGGIFNVATRVGTSLGLAVASSISSSVSSRFLQQHPNLSADDPSVILPGLRAAGLTCLGAALFSLIVAVVFLRDLGIVGKTQEKSNGSTPTTVASESTENDKAVV